MNRSARILAALAIMTLMLGASGCNKLRARDALNKGVQAYKQAKYEQAVERFKDAINYDPGLTNARLYLATAYAQQYIPGVDSPDNNRYAEQAIEQYQEVLKNDATNVGATKGIAYLYLQMKKFEEAKEYYRKAIALDPNDPEAYYSVAVIEWTQAYQPRMEARNKENIGTKPEEPIKDKKVCAELRDKNMGNVDDGIQNLEKAISLRQDYEDAMAYLNLLYRERADLQCDDKAARQADLKTADEWVEKTMATKKAKAEKAQQQGGIVLEQQAQPQQ